MLQSNDGLTPKNYRLNWYEMGGVLLFLIVVMIWAHTRPFSLPNPFPDEAARLTVPFFIYHHGYLPTGNELSVRYIGAGLSYATYPLLLSSVIGAGFMKVMSWFSTNNNQLVFAARLVSCFAATGTVYFAMKISKRVFRAAYAPIFVALVAFLPQFTFLGAYFNNDALALFASAMILYAWVWALQGGWNYRNSLLLAIGIAICALAYFNAYGWILMSIFFYFALWFTKRKNIDWSRFWRCTLLIVGVVLLIAGPFFLRNALIHNGDFIGLKTATQQSVKWAAESYKPSNRQMPKNIGISFWQVLTTHHYTQENWIMLTAASTVGVFGSMNVPLPTIIYVYYGAIIMLGGLAFLGVWARRLYKKQNLWQISEQRGADFVFTLSLLGASIIPIFLSLQYSYAIDYQPQGRYILPMLLALMLLVACGLCSLIARLRWRWLQRLIIGIFVLSLALIWLYAYRVYAR